MAIYGSNVSGYYNDPVDNGWWNNYGRSSGPAGQNPSASAVQTAAQVNAQNIAAQTQANQARLGPSGVALQSTLLGNAQRQAEGLLDPETEQMLREGIASSGVSSGMGVDSPNLASAYRRALGLDIKDVENQGLQAYNQLTSDNPGAQVFGVQNLLTQPERTSTSAPSIRGGGGGGAAATPTYTAPAVAYGGGYPSPESSAPYDYSNPFSAEANDSSLFWTGQDFTNLFGDPYAESSLSYAPTGGGGGYSPTAWDYGTNWDTGATYNPYF